jgi:hypothetical protein
MSEMTEQYHFEVVQEFIKDKSVVITSKCCAIFDSLMEILDVFSVKVDKLKLDKGGFLFSA